MAGIGTWEAIVIAILVSVIFAGHKWAQLFRYLVQNLRKSPVSQNDSPTTTEEQLENKDENSPVASEPSEAPEVVGPQK